MKKLIFTAVVGVLMVMPTEMWAWSQKGHRIIAELAYQHLSAGARNKIDKVLGKHGIVYVANWADEIKSDTIYPQSHKEGWHYQDMNAGMTDEEVIAAMKNYPKEGGSLFRVTDSLRTLLKKDPNNHDALVFLVHIAGDRYCPVHMGHMDDAGGNKVKMKWFGSHTNLHAVWDSKIVDSQGYSYTEYAQFLMDKYGSECKRVQQMSEEELVVENYHVISDIYAYQETFDGNTYHYIYKFHQPMEWQLYKAGIRLAVWLEEIY